MKLLLLLASILLLAACSESPQLSESLAEASDDTALEHAMKHLDPTYICPMHPQITSDEPGNCPICGMNLVEKNHKAVA